jgi:hypothetical protein
MGNMTAVPPNSGNTKYCLPYEYEIYTDHYWTTFILVLDGLTQSRALV